MRFIFLCTGNICRSPYAEHKLRAMLAREGLTGITVQSYGLAAAEARPCPEATQELGRAAGLDLSTHRARQLTPEVLEQHDQILVMEAEHLRRLRDLVPAVSSAQVRLLTDFCPGPRRPAEVPDPHRAERWGHALTCGLIDTCIEGLILALKQAPREPSSSGAFQGPSLPSVP